MTVPPTRPRFTALSLGLLALAAGLLPQKAFAASWPPEISRLFDAFFYEIEIGPFRVSAARTVLALLLFFAILYLARVVRRSVAAALARHSPADPGIAYSIDKALGYAGFAVALLVALSYGGFDLSSLTIIAGALSVGIGFGLQQIANNFIAGAVLLAERPIRVGDRISLKGEEGTVRRIGLRATEIELSSQGSLIVPNIDLITSPVINRAQKGPAPSTVTVHVGVAQGSDPQRVLEVLASAAEEAPLLSRVRPPEVRFDAIGTSAFEFSVEATPAPGSSPAQAETHLRAAIVEALQKAEIAIARPQADVHLRDLDALRSFLARAAQARLRQSLPAGENATEVPPPPPQDSGGQKQP